MAKYTQLIDNLRACAEMRSNSLYKRSLMQMAADVIEKLSADVRENVRGHWIVQRSNYNEKFECSVCHHVSKDGGNYCPNCGADMRRP